MASSASFKSPVLIHLAQAIVQIYAYHHDSTTIRTGICSVIKLSLYYDIQSTLRVIEAYQELFLFKMLFHGGLIKIG